jgi:23S rRNA (adenine2503-C2)-methyltransferase
VKSRRARDGRVDLIGLPRPRIVPNCSAKPGLMPRQAKLRAKQVFHWLYHRGVTDFEAMTDIAKTMRPWLAERFVIGRPDIVLAQHSTDGTRKWLLRTADGHDFEMVFIPDADARHAVRFQPGRLHAQLPVLPHRHHAAGAQPDRRGDRRAGHAGARCAGRMAQGQADGRPRWDDDLIDDEGGYSADGRC